MKNNWKNWLISFVQSEQKRKPASNTDKPSHTHFEDNPNFQMFAATSHEIRTSLNAIKGMISLLLEDEKLTSAQKDKLEITHSASQNLMRIINDVIDHSQLKEGRMGLELQTFSPTELVENAVGLMVTSAQAKNAEISAYVAPNVPNNLRGDAGRIRQILANFISNAIKFTPNGAIMLEVDIEEEFIHTAKLRFKIADTGCGIPEELQKDLFQSFNKAGRETSSTHGGSGLGLSICKNLVELMGGDIYFKSVEGEGSTFYFTLPLQKVTSGSSQRHYTPNLKEKRILVVDDHNFNRYIFQKQLEKIGADVVTVEDGPSAITALKDAALNRTPYDLAILDQNMPNMTGEELAEYLRVESIHPPIKLVLASSENISSNIAHYKELGFDSVFVKPVQESKLLNSVSRLLSEKTISSPSMELQELDILLVEDNLINQVFTQGTLKKHVKSVTIANNGVEAVEHFKKQTFSLILMDAQMPEMDGCEATKNIRLIEKAEGLSPLPIIGLTAGADEQNRSNCLQAGMNEVLLKPIDAIDLIAKIHEYAIEETESTPKKQKQN